MKVSIASRYRLFSHEIGASCLLPRTGLVVQAFPALIRIDRIEVPLPLTGPVKEFTLEQDLERGCVFIWGVAKEGRFRIRIEAKADGIEWHAEKAFEGIPPALWWNRTGAFCDKTPKERFSLGCHRAQDIDLAWRRFDLQEMLPLLYRLSQWTPAYGRPELQMCKLGFEELLRGAFLSILTPHWVDEKHQGLLPIEKTPPDLPAAALVHFLGAKIRKLFIDETEEGFVIPKPSFPFGRFVDVQLPKIGALDLEWSKGAIRKVILRATHTRSLSLKTSSHSFRLRSNLKEKGRSVSSHFFEIEAGCTYYLDHFQK